MPSEVQFDQSVDCYFVHWTGALDREGLWGFMRGVVGEPWFHSGVNVLHDFRDATAAPQQIDVLKLAQNSRPVKKVFGDSGRVAFLVPEQEEEARVARTFAALVGGAGREYKVFIGWDEATGWLGLPDDYELPADHPSK